MKRNIQENIKNIEDLNYENRWDGVRMAYE